MEKFIIFRTRIEDCIYAVLSLLILLYTNGASAFTFGAWTGALLSSLIISTILVRLPLPIVKNSRIHSSYFALILVWMAVALVLNWGWGWFFVSGILVYLAVEIPFLLFAIKLKGLQLVPTLKKSFVKYKELYGRHS